MNILYQHIEALIFCSEQSISLDEIAASLKLSFDWEPSDNEILEGIEQLRIKYRAEEFSFELLEISGGYQFLTKKDFHPTISALIQHKSKKKLSVPQMETLSIIAYKQPVTKSEIEHIRGVNCDYAIQKLLEKELVEISGKSEGPGRPILYSTSKNFMDYFGIKSVKDLPQLKDIHMEQNEIGQPAEMNELQEYAAEQEAAGELTEEAIQEASDHSFPLSENVISTETIEVTEILTFESEPPSFENEDEDLPLPDRKAIFLQNEASQDLSSEEKIQNLDNEGEMS